MFGPRCSIGGSKPLSINEDIGGVAASHGSSRRQTWELEIKVFHAYAPSGNFDRLDIGGRLWLTICLWR